MSSNSLATPARFSSHNVVHFFRCDNFGALRLEELTNCTVLCGPVSGSVYVDKCQGCTIFVAARQIRIHRSVGCDFCVCTARRVARCSESRMRAVRLRLTRNVLSATTLVSGPIIEDCSSMRFAPFTFRYPALDAHLAAANLSLASHAWSDVKVGARAPIRAPATSVT